MNIKVRNLTASTPKTFIRKEPAPFNFSGDFPFEANSLSAYKAIHNSFTWILFPIYPQPVTKIKHTFCERSTIKHMLFFSFIKREKNRKKIEKGNCGSYPLGLNPNFIGYNIQCLQSPGCVPVPKLLNKSTAHPPPPPIVKYQYQI